MWIPGLILRWSHVHESSLRRLRVGRLSLGTRTEGTHKEELRSCVKKTRRKWILLGAHIVPEVCNAVISVGMQRRDVCGTFQPSETVTANVTSVN